MKNIAHHELLAAALAGYERHLQDIQERIDALRARLGIKSRTIPGARKRRVLSAAARKRIAAAQRKRWAAYKKAKRAT